MVGEGLFWALKPFVATFATKILGIGYGKNLLEVSLLFFFGELSVIFLADFIPMFTAELSPEPKVSGIASI